MTNKDIFLLLAAPFISVIVIYPLQDFRKYCKNKITGWEFAISSLTAISAATCILLTQIMIYFLLIKK